MKPHRIILIRHGECHANTDESKFATEPDYTIELTEKGIRQAQAAGQKLKDLVGEETMYFYVSPFWRTRSTFENIAQCFPRKQFEYSEEPRLREQEWGYLRTYNELQELKKKRKEYGIFYYRFPGGEAGTDVYDRINDLLGSLHRDFRNENYPQNCILITHSLAIRLFIMRWFHLTVEELTLSKILCKWKQDSAVSLFLYLDSVFKNKHKLVHNQAPVMNRLCPFLLNLHK